MTVIQSPLTVTIRSRFGPFRDQNVTLSVEVTA